ncbi:DEAD/DEAH box helicase [Halolamina salina]|uniref:DEAD/DEAH box helicase n=1 Tax=Halolamina salina TaxID=1220023 RepID=A0ABD6BA62_9EURY
MDWERFKERCHEQIRKSDGDRYSVSYIRRILSTYAEIGVIEREDDVVRAAPFADEYRSGEIPFAEFLWRCLKRSWVAKAKKPEGIEGLSAVMETVEDTSGGLKLGEIESRLAAEDDYEFNDQGIRGYPDLLILLRIFEKEGHTYSIADSETVKRYKRRFRSTDVFDTLEAHLKREGSLVTPPSDTAKRDLMKYYMYRESGGWSKRGQWYRTFWKDYLKPETRNGNTGSELRRKDKYRNVDSKRKSLRDQIVSRYDSFESQDLSGLSTSVLERIESANSQQEAHRIQLSAGSGMSKADLELLATDDRPAYTFDSEFSLYDWQKEAASEWFQAGQGSEAQSGIAQVVTGAGKTVMALEVVRRWLQQSDEDRVVTVVVPTKVLMHQWLTELVSTLNVPIDDIGWAGGGTKHNFEDCKILVSIVNSAVKDDYLGNALEAVGTPEHLLIADECHRYTGDKFSNIFTYPRAASLGLSATPLSREDDLTDSDKLLLRELGDIYYRLRYDEGINRGLIPEFTIQYVGFDLAGPERNEYEELSRQVSDAVKEIQERYQGRLHELPGGFSQKLQTIRNEVEGPTGAIADYFRFTQERRELVANAVSRQAITLQLLDNAVERGDKTIVFQERIEQLEQLVAPWEHRGIDAGTKEVADTESASRQRLYQTFDGLEEVDQEIENLFAQSDFWPVMYHSGHRRDVWNDISMDWFREDDMANVMLSVKALVEGVDVPSADVGIVRVSSSSIRQRIQTLGRILRTGEDASQESTLYVLYARDTVDERIFREYDWKEELASAKVEHRVWERDDDSFTSGTIRPAEPDELPPRPEKVPPAEDLDFGEVYDGPWEQARELSVDSRGKLFRKGRAGREYLEPGPLEDAVEFVLREKGGGRIKITEHGFVLSFIDGEPIFLGTVDDDYEFQEEDTPTRITDDPETDSQEDSSSSLTEEPDDYDDIFE